MTTGGSPEFPDSAELGSPSAAPDILMLGAPARTVDLTAEDRRHGVTAEVLHEVTSQSPRLEEKRFNIEQAQEGTRGLLAKGLLLLLVYCLAFGFAVAIGFAHEYAAAGALNLPAS